MATDPTKTPPATPGAPQSPHGPHPVRIYTYPKIIFIAPTVLVSLICGIGMLVIHDRTVDPKKAQADVAPPAASSPEARTAPPAPADATATDAARQQIRRFTSTQNVLAMIFLATLLLNMVTLSFDFPRFTLFAVLLLVVAGTLGILLLNEHYAVIPAVANAAESLYAVANAQFYFLMALIIGGVLLTVFLTRRLDYWEIMPNEILHNHGPLSDLERFPTFNLKFDKEIPDILEYMMPFMWAGRLVLHVTNERRSIVLDNVLNIDRVEEKLKQMMSRMEVRVAPDQEIAESM